MKGSEKNAAGCAMWYYRYSVALMYCGRLEEALNYADVLFDSTLFSTDKFKLDLCESCGMKNFLKIQDLLDDILNIEEKIIVLNNKLLENELVDEKAQKIAFKIGKLKNELKLTFIKTQNLIYSSYFDNEFNKLNTTQEIEIYRTKLYNYKNYIGITENYNDFNSYYINKMVVLEEKHEAILNNVSLVLVKEGKISRLFNNIKTLLKLNKNLENDENL